MKHHATTVGVFAAIGGCIAGVYLTYCGVSWLVDHITLKGVKATFSFIAFWLFIACLIRLAWHLGSKWKAQADATKGGRP